MPEESAELRGNDGKPGAAAEGQAPEEEHAADGGQRDVV